MGVSLRERCEVSKPKRSTQDTLLRTPAAGACANTSDVKTAARKAFETYQAGMRPSIHLVLSDRWAHGRQEGTLQQRSWRC